VSYAFGERSKARLSTCHPLLIALFGRVIRRPDLPHDLTILCGHRGQAEQEKAYKAGASRLRWPNSKHNQTPSMAVDVAPIVGGAVSWDWAAYHKIAPIIRAEWAAMQAEGLTGATRLEWGGDFATLKDGPHWQLA